MNKATYFIITLLLFLLGIYIGTQFKATQQPITETTSDTKMLQQNTSPNQTTTQQTEQSEVDKANLASFRSSIKSTQASNQQADPSPQDTNQEDDRQASISITTKQNIAQQFEEQAIDYEWSHTQTEKITHLFNDQIAQESGILLQSVECKSSICSIELVNFDSNKERLEAMVILDTVYSVSWPQGTLTHIQPSGDDPNTQTLLLAMPIRQVE